MNSQKISILKINEILNAELAHAIGKDLEADDYETIAARYGRSANSLRQVVYRQTPVTLKLKIVVEAMMKQAKSNHAKRAQIYKLHAR